MPEIPDSKLSSTYFNTFFNNAVQNCVVIMDKQGTITAINPAFTSRFGYDEKDIIGKKSLILFTPEDQQKGLPEKELTAVLTTGQGSDNNYLVSKNKTLTWVSGESLLVKNNNDEVAILKIVHDIHEQKSAENELVYLYEFNENILGAIEDAVIVVDDKLNVIKANKAFSKLFNYYRDSATINLAGIISPYDVLEEIKTNISKTINTKKAITNTPFEIEMASGEKGIFDVSCSLIQHNQGEDHVLLVIHDITVHKLAEREREDLIGFVAHELRNPLANLVLCNDVMSEALKENDVEEIADMLQRNKNNVGRLNKMISELYDAAKVNSGNLRLDISRFKFADMIQEAIDTVEGLQPIYNIIVKGDANVEVEADKHRLIQVVTNYLTNGIKYSNGNTDVVLTVYYDNSKVTVSVKDEGVGISSKQLPFIFERFFRAEKTKNLEGIGLGLYLCRQIIHSHNGHVWAESEEGRGSTFYFSVPLK